MTLSNPERLPYLQIYADRHGRQRVYFRRQGMAAIPLPTSIGTTVFRRAYEAALAKMPDDNVRQKVTRKIVKRQQHADKWALQSRIKTTGVYLLMLDNQIVYVGSSTHMANRVAEHRRNGRPFDRAFFIGTRADERQVLEALLIRKLQPIGNVRI